jgi:hypothetical protein
MNLEPSGRRRRWSGAIRRFAERHPVGAFLVLAIAIGVAGFALSVAGPSQSGAAIIKAGGIVLFLLSPVLLIGGTAYVIRAVRRIISTRRGEMYPRPNYPPIEEIAADLRRLLWQHDTFARSNDVAMRNNRLWVLQAAITISATQAARALGVPHPDPPEYGGFDQPQPRRLLRALAAEGLVLPPTVAMMAPDSRR